MPKALPHVLTLAIALGSGFAQTKLPDEIVLTLRGVDGKPVVEEVLAVRFVTKDSHHYSLAETDDRGVLRIETPEAFLKSPRGSLRLQRAAWSDGDAGADERIPTGYRGGKAIPFAELRQAGTRQVKLDAPQLAVAGQVVDREGKPLAGAIVSIGANVNTHMQNFEEDPDRTMYERTVKADAEGRFAIHELDDGRGGIHVKVQSDTHLKIGNEPIEVGTKDAKIVVGRLSKVHAKVLGVPERERLLSLYARLLPKEKIPGIEHFEARFGGRDGVFLFQRCVSGTYDFVLTEDYFAKGKPLVKIENVKVEPGKDCKDPRLAAIDISHLFAWAELEVVDETGAPIPRARMRIHNKSGGSRGYSSRRGKRWVLVPKDGADVDVSAEGYRRKKVKVQKSTRIVLKAAWSFAIRIENLPELEASEIEVRVSVGSDYRNRMDRGKSSFRLDRPDHSESLPVDTPGTLDLELVAVTPLPERERGMIVHGGRRRGEHIRLGSRKIVVHEDQETGKEIALVWKLSLEELAVVKSFDAVLKERNK